MPLARIVACAATVLLVAGLGEASAVPRSGPPPDTLQLGRATGPVYSLSAGLGDVSDFSMQVAPGSGHCALRSRYEHAAYGGRTSAVGRIGESRVRTGSRAFVKPMDARCREVIAEIRQRTVAGSPPRRGDTVGPLHVEAVEADPPAGWPSFVLVEWSRTDVERSPAGVRGRQEPAYWFGPRFRARRAVRAVEHDDVEVFRRPTRARPTSYTTLFYERHRTGQDGTAPSARPYGDVWVTARPVAETGSRRLLARAAVRHVERVRLVSGEAATVIGTLLDEPGRPGFTVVTGRALVLVRARLQPGAAVAVARRLRRLA